MIFSTLALVIGFLALTTSGFIPTVSFGALSCLTLAGGLIGTLQGDSDHIFSEQVLAGTPKVFSQMVAMFGALD
jgi:hypothetical protein